MSNKIKNYIISILALLLLISICYIIQIYKHNPINVCLFNPCVNNEETAITITKAIIEEKYDYTFDMDDFVACEDVYNWQVHLKNEEDFDERVIVNDDSGVYINKQNGTIERIFIYEKDIEKYFKLKESMQYK